MFSATDIKLTNRIFRLSNGVPVMAAQERNHVSLKQRASGVKNQIKELKWGVLALYLARKDPRIPLKSRIVIAIAVGYMLSPVDIIPDFIPVLGYLDDILIVPALIGYAIKSVPPDLLNDYRKKARIEFRDGSPRAYKAAAVIILLWAGALLLILYWVWKMVF